MKRHEFDNESRITSDIEARMFSTSKPRDNYKLFCWCYYWSGRATDETLPCSVYMHSWFSLYIRMTIEMLVKPFMTQVPSSRLINMSFVMKIIYRFRQPMGKEKFHTRVYLLLYGYVQKKCTWNPFLRSHENLHSLLTSIMKMLSHLSVKTHLFQELNPCGTTLVIWV